MFDPPSVRLSLFDPRSVRPSLFDPSSGLPSLFDPSSVRPSLFDPPSVRSSLFDPPSVRDSYMHEKSRKLINFEQCYAYDFIPDVILYGLFFLFVIQRDLNNYFSFVMCICKYIIVMGNKYLIIII